MSQRHVPPEGWRGNAVATAVWEAAVKRRDDRGLDLLLDAVIERLQAAVPGLRVVVGLADEAQLGEQRWIPCGETGLLTERGAEALRKGQPVWNPCPVGLDVSGGPESPGWRWHEVAYPIAGDQGPLGVLVAQSLDAAGAEASLLGEIETVVALLGQLMRSNGSQERSGRRIEDLTFLDRLSQSLSATAHVPELLRRAAEVFASRGRYEVVALSLVEEDEVVVGVVDGRDVGDLRPGFRQPLGQGVAGRVACTGEHVLTSEVSPDDFWGPLAGRLGQRLCCPLRTSDEVIGCLDLACCAGQFFGPAEVEVLLVAATRTATVLQQALRLHQLNKLKDEVGTMLVHDLRNPVTVMQSALQLLAIHLDKLPQHDATLAHALSNVQRYLRNAQGACQEMLVLISGLLELPKLESGTVSLQWQACSAGDLLRMVARQLQVVAEAREIELEVGVSSELPTLHCDIDLVSRVLMNLAHNALRYTPAGGRVRLSVERAAAEVLGQRLPSAGEAFHFAVDDTGPGVPEKDRNRIFEKFAVVEAREGGKKTSSTGLGLAFCRQAIEAHGGAIWVDGCSLAGTRFSLLLPLRKSVPDRVPPPEC